MEDIQTRATFIRTYDGQRVVIPNAELFTGTVGVKTAFEHRRLVYEYDIGIGYGDDGDRAPGVILNTVRSTEGLLAELAPDVLLMNFSPSSVNLRLRWWIAPPKRADALDARGREREGWPAGQADVPTPRKVTDAIAQISRPNARPGDGE